MLDLDDGRIITTHYRRDPVWFDIDADGELEQIGWTAPETEEGILWLDLNRNGLADDGSELFGDVSWIPTGEEPENGFLALAIYDRSEFGGDQDGLITRGDVIYSQLRIWVDENHDGQTQHDESRTLGHWKVEAIDLSYEPSDLRDGALNVHRFVGRWYQRVQNEIVERGISDVYFRIAHKE